MTPAQALLLGLSLATDAAGQLAFKQASLSGLDTPATWQRQWMRYAAEPWIWVGIGCFVLEFVLWLAVLSILPLSQGVLLASASTLVMLAGGRIFFGERLGPAQILGGALIAAGVAIVGLN